MKAHIFQHVPFEKPSAILDWLTGQNFDITYTRFYESTHLPSLHDVDWLIIMGGPMSVNDEKELPWLIDEKNFIRQCIQSGKVVVGVCLGAQLIASATGSKIYPGKHKEIGWFPVYPVQNNEIQTHPIPKEITVLHWHGETFDLPQGARLLASTEACANQIFMIDKHVLGMQCHLEMTPEAVAGMLKYCAHEIQPAPFIQTVEDINNGTLRFALNANLLLFSLLQTLKENTTI